MIQDRFLRFKFCVSVCMLVLGVGLAERVQATVIYENPWDSNALDGGAHSHNAQNLAGEFVLISGASVNRAEWYGTMFSSDPLDTGDNWDFAVRFYEDSAGLPGGLIVEHFVSAAVIDTGIDISGERSYQFSADFPGVALDAATFYWFSVVNTGLQDTFRWTRSTSGLASASTANSAWIPLTTESRSPLNFALSSFVPEPTSLALGAFALGTIGCVRRQRRSS